MCGIAGIFRFRGQGEDLTIVQAMLTCLERRGPDDVRPLLPNPLYLRTYFANRNVRGAINHHPD